MNVGFIGLGIMGNPMSTNLVQKGFNVYVYDLLPENVKKLEEIGAHGVSSYKEMAENCEVVITMLPNWPHVEKAFLGEDGIAKYIAKGSLLIDCSSVAPEQSKRICGELNKLGLRMLDAPVSGGHAGAVAGKLSIMVGGEEKDYLEAKPIFEALGNGGVLIGPIGAGNTAKIANQIMVAANLAAAAEALTLAEKSGLDMSKVWDAVKGGFAGSTAAAGRMEKILSNNYEASFAIDTHWKDLNNALDAGYAVDSPTPLTLQIFNMFNYLRAEGLGKCDHSAVKKYYEEHAGIKK